MADKPAPNDLPTGIWRFGHARFDARGLLLSVRGVEVEVPKKSLVVLAALLDHAGETVTKDELAEACWPGRILSETVLTTTVSRLRSALGEEDGAAIQTVKGRGYRITVPVSFDGPEPAAAPRLTLKVGDHPPGRPDWRLVETLGAGGQADVWLGRHVSTGEQRVFKFAIDLRAVAALRREVAIDRLLDEVSGDASGAGFVPVLDRHYQSLPAFIASPLIDGGSLDQWARRQGGLNLVPLALRLDLVAQCAAVLAIAHEAGVLHKDLKPGNLLVDTASGTPRIRIADFGSALVTDRERLRRYAMTRIGAAANTTIGMTQLDSSSGTPMYMAPEVLAGQASTARSDLYALGILLYQSVIGDFRRPLAAGWEQEIADPLLREDIAACAAGDPLRRLGDAAELARRLRDLDSRRLARDAEQAESRRAEVLQRELERHRQRRPLVIGIGAALAAGLISVSVLGWQLRGALEEARRSTALVTAINDFMQKDILANASPGQTGKPAATMVDVMKMAQSRIAERFADMPLQEGAVRRTIGAAWHVVGNDPDAEDQLRKAIAVLEPLGDEARLELARAHLALGKNLSIRGIAEYQSHLDRAEALTAQQQADPAFWRVHVQTLRARAHALFFSAKTREALAIAEPLYREVRSKVEGDDPLLLDLSELYLEMLNHAGRDAEALAIARRVLPLLESGRGKELGDAASVRLNMGRFLRQLGQPDEARAIEADAIERFTAVLGPNHVETLNARLMVASRRSVDGEPDAAIAEMRSLLEPIRAAQGELAYSVRAASMLAEAVVAAGLWPQAETDARVALDETTRILPTDGDARAYALARLGEVLSHRGRHDEAAPLIAEAAALLDQSSPEDWRYAATRQRCEGFLLAASR